MAYFYQDMPSPIGTLRLIASDAGLAAVLWENDDPQRVALPVATANPTHAILCLAAAQLQEYFTGQRRTFSVPLAFTGTAFQQSVWQALLAIPYGKTRSYGQLATQLGNAKAMRAVGAANGKNPLSIIAPCHRVVGAAGSLTGFAGGLAAKAFLLKLESADAPQLSFL